MGVGFLRFESPRLDQDERAILHVCLHRCEAALDGMHRRATDSALLLLGARSWRARSGHEV
jgi:hypothetical protein